MAYLGREAKGMNIIHSAKQQEAVVQGVKVDGYNPETKQIFEFHGCYYHGCPVCYKHSRDEPLYENPTETLNLRYETTISKIDRLRNLDYEVIEMWECQFNSALKNEEIKTYTEYHPLVALTPLNPRDAFYGGRTGNTRSYYKCKPGEKVKYVDVCSLYPWVCKYGKFPIGHPKVHVGEECKQTNLKTTNGLIKCKILPPEELYHPVLPTKMNDKLMFVLCRVCGETMNDKECNHSETDRALTGTWVIDEIVKAIEKGYKLLETYEIWKYEVLQFNKATHTEEFVKREDVELEFAEIIENPGLRSLAKLILNSFFGANSAREKTNRKTKIIRNCEEFTAMLINPSIYVNSALPINEDTLVVNWEHIDEAADMLSTVNVAIASYVTTQARLKLYSYLEQLTERVLYFDTDSIIFVSTEDDEYDVAVGEFIGDMTDELETYGPDSYITEFVSGGPKNYAYKVCSGDHKEKVVCKVKGISLTHEASQKLNFNAIKDMVLTPSPPLYITSNNIRRTKEHQVVTKQETKIYKANSTKRKFFEDHSSAPYGYKKLKGS
ncbi:hypothetical protein NQ317_002426 [Molorchus minor]|uniref:DNA-directed DNA polymerase n=1 Tax=Molorchus minor TaxID=1323400 RepID=A0ABQ9IQS6_9CUCU|nr:hypothetical protein NQ317_002426 [Molorchus minor]